MEQEDLEVEVMELHLDVVQMELITLEVELVQDCLMVEQAAQES
jgi:hypothetical protein